MENWRGFLNEASFQDRAEALGFGRISRAQAQARPYQFAIWNNLQGTGGQVPTFKVLTVKAGANLPVQTPNNINIASLEKNIEKYIKSAAGNTATRNGFANDYMNGEFPHNPPNFIIKVQQPTGDIYILCKFQNIKASKRSYGLLTIEAIAMTNAWGVHPNWIYVVT